MTNADVLQSKCDQKYCGTRNVAEMDVFLELIDFLEDILEDSMIGKPTRGRNTLNVIGLKKKTMQHCIISVCQ